MSNSVGVRARTPFSETAENARKLRAKECPGTGDDLTGTPCLGSLFAPVDDIRTQIIASRIRLRCTELGLTQGGLAGRATKTPRELRRWMNAEHAPSWPNIQLLAGALDCSPLWLAGLSEDKEPEAITL